MHQDLKNEAFGVEVYDYLVLYMEALVGNHPDLIDHNIVRHLHILWEHKKALHDRLLYLMKNEYMEHNEAILEISSQNIQKAVYMRNYVLKRLNSVFVSTKKLQADLIKMKEILEEIKNAEIEMLQRVLEELDKSKLKQKSILT
ncbi:hypothetical protein [Caldalkalibacillus mannanilyticus]|uniref:hypothetical protein n=1 Tax=Caldalkalibacillus mannanilyticus TaxID=1418 RepID=UPI0004690A62|nr:hypothetical protein [Caldalkalibacillus mannanilyticus]